jgi:DtxR family Mn-dependent transcriptional regulator
MEKSSGRVIPLSELPVGSAGVVVGLQEAMRGVKKFADAGMVPGAELFMQSHAPLGSLLRIKLLGCSLALHKNEGRCIMVQVC